MSFQATAKSIKQLTACYKPGLQALGGNSSKIKLFDTRRCNGSIDLDNCLKHSHPNDSRWDFIIGYNDKAYFAEVHPASGQVSEVIAKVTWLRGWLKSTGAPLAAIHADGNFHWIPPSGVKIIGKQRQLLAQNKVVIKSQLNLK